MAELWYDRMVHHDFKKGIKSKASKLSPYQHQKGHKDLVQGMDGFVHERSYKAKGFRKHHPIP